MFPIIEVVQPTSHTKAQSLEHRNKHRDTEDLDLTLGAVCALCDSVF